MFAAVDVAAALCTRMLVAWGLGTAKEAGRHGPPPGCAQVFFSDACALAGSFAPSKAVNFQM